MLESIITSKSRIRLLLKFFLNPEVKAYLRQISNEFGESTNSVRVELNRLVDAKLLRSEKSGRNVFYSANTEHPLFPDINNILKKMTGLDHISDLLSKVGSLDAVYVSGDYASGVDSGIIDLVLVGDLDNHRLQDYISKTELIIKRKIRSLILTDNEFKTMNGKFQKENMLLLWGNGSC